jgi:hypothetical protein
MLSISQLTGRQQGPQLGTDIELVLHHNGQKAQEQNLHGVGSCAHAQGNDHSPLEFARSQPFYPKDQRTKGPKEKCESFGEISRAQFNDRLSSRRTYCFLHGEPCARRCFAHFDT